MGRVWEAADGSRVSAKLLKTAAAPDKHSPAWQLYKVIEHKGEGRFKSVEWIQRIDNMGEGATYLFYGKQR